MLKETQAEVGAWSKRNFGEVPNSQLPLKLSAFLGMVEELGELAHAVLKWGEGIRGTPEEHLEGVKDALADLLIYTLDFSARNGLEAEDLLRDVWAKVKQRDWQKHKQNGTGA